MMEPVQKTEKLKGFLDTALKCWRRLNMSITPKLHLLEDHLFDILQHVKMLEYYNEEFVERAHQKGNKYDRVMKGMSRNPSKKYEYLVRLEQAHASSALERSKDRKSVNKKRGGKHMKLEHQQKRIASMEMAIKELNDLPPYFFQSADEMNVIISRGAKEG